MPYSTCCGAETEMTEIGICPDCLEHCDFEDEDEEEIKKDIKAENELEQLLINKNETKC